MDKMKVVCKTGFKKNKIPGQKQSVALEEN